MGLGLRSTPSLKRLERGSKVCKIRPPGLCRPKVHGEMGIQGRLREATYRRKNSGGVESAPPPQSIGSGRSLAGEVNSPSLTWGVKTH